MRSWAEAAACCSLTLAGCAGATPATPRTGLLDVEIAGRATPVRVALVPAEIDAAGDHVVTPLGARGTLLLLTDSYASRGAGLSRCAAGHETWLRLIETRTRRERWSRRVESCLHDVLPGDPVAAWTGAGATTGFTVNLLSEPGMTVDIFPGGRIVTRD